MDNMVQLSTRIPRNIWKAARLDAIQRGIPFHVWVAQAIEMRLRSPEKTGGLVGGDAGGEAPTGGR
jgi:hypothetical protein